MSRLCKVILLIGMVQLLALGAAGAAFGLAECASCRAWWHVTSASVPAVLQSGSATDEVQDVAVSATSGEFVLEDVKLGETGEFDALFKWDASAREVQEGLEGIYGPGNVEVPRGQGNEEGSDPYEIVFKGALGDQSVKPVAAPYSNIFLGCESAKGPACKGRAQVQEKVGGRPDGEIVLTAVNVGDATVDAGSVPVTVTDRLPPGLTPVSIEGFAGQTFAGNTLPTECSIAPAVSCTFSEGTLPPDLPLQVTIGVNVTGAVSGANGASVSGGENEGSGDAVAGDSVTRAVQSGDRPAPAGIEDYELTPEEAGGALDTQAGSHPFQVTTTLMLNTTLKRSAGAPGLTQQPVALTKDLRFKWPAGMVGNPTPIPRCKTSQFVTETNTVISAANECPADSAVGFADVALNNNHGVGGSTRINSDVPVFNLEPNEGEPARLGFFAGTVPVYIDTSIRSGEDYGVTVDIDNVTEEAEFIDSVVTIWGVPGDARHDISRGWGCLWDSGKPAQEAPCQPSEEEHPAAFLSMPSACPRDPGTGVPEPMQSSAESDTWEAPGVFDELPSTALPALAGCARLPFTPSIAVKPDSEQAASASGLTVDVHVPQNESLNAAGLAEADPRDITVALPEGVQVNPSGGNGLQACSEGLIGYEGARAFPGLAGAEMLTFKSRLPGSIAAVEAGEQEALRPGVNFCPDAAKIGTAEVRTPLLPNPAKGAVYLAAQNENPFGSLVAMYLVVEEPQDGVLIKLAGRVRLGETGQLVATFENSPQAPFEDAVLNFFGGERAPLATPARCGSYTTNASFTPWAAEPGETPVTASSTFHISSGPNGRPCPGASLPFSPSLTGGSTNINAGAFTPLTTTIGREDGEQSMQSVTLHFPPGLSGLLSSVKLCGEQQANEGKCGPESLIGETTASAGVGSDPVSITGGKVYITEKYEGAPFGLSIVVPPKAGPLDLEHDTSNPAYQAPCDCIVVRAKVEVDPHTAALTVRTAASGPHAIPTVLDGIPVQIKKVNVLINRPGFTFNPTNCDATSITGSIGSEGGASSPVAVPFQVTNCAALKFEPKLTVSTSGKTSRADGASLSLKLTKPDSQGVQAGIARFKVELPKALPSRLSTLQRACRASVFDANPASCPSEAIVGHMKIVTAELPVPLEGPMYFVSNGGEAFPNLVVVLQGYGVTIELVGDTFISKSGVTSSTFKSLPDAPFSSAEVTLPEGRFSALGANRDLCALAKTVTTKKTVREKVHGETKRVVKRTTRKVAGSLVVPTEMVSQAGGAPIVRDTPVAVTGCAKAVARKKAKKGKQGRKGTKGGKKK
jgi:hypothetical protein